MLIAILIFHSEINQSTDYENMKVTRIRNMGTFSHDIFLKILMYNIHKSFAKKSGSLAAQLTRTIISNWG